MNVKNTSGTKAAEKVGKHSILNKKKYSLGLDFWRISSLSLARIRLAVGGEWLTEISVLQPSMNC